MTETVSSGLIADLRRIVGGKAVLNGEADRLLYSYDAAFRGEAPAAVVLPGSAREVSEVCRYLHRERIPFAARGMGTSLAGGPVPSAETVVICLNRLNRILRLVPERFRATVEPGVVNLHLQEAAKRYGLFFAPDPASQRTCTIGGNVATNAGGLRCLKYGVTSRHVLGLEWVMPDGEILHTRTAAEGPEVVGLLVGSEGTLGIATKITVRLTPAPKAAEALLGAFASVEKAMEATSRIIAAGVLPATLEVMDRAVMEAVQKHLGPIYPPQAQAVLLMEADGDPEQVRAEADRMETICRDTGALCVRRALEESSRQRLWEGRKSAYPAMARISPNVLVEDGTVPRPCLAEALAGVERIARKYDLKIPVVAHAGDGNLHPMIAYDERRPETFRLGRQAGREILKMCVELGGSISGEHGIGLDKKEAMAWQFSAETLELFHRIKSVFDPAGLANPGKMLPDPVQASAPAPAREDALGRPLQEMEEPDSVEELQKIVSAAARAGRKIRIRGSGSKAAENGALLLSTRRLNRILEYDPENFTVTVEAGLPLEEFRRWLEAKGRHAHLAGTGTIGGILATRQSAEPALRDQVLGVQAVLGDGRWVRLGGKVLKNVAGYDAGKCFIGAWGWLGVVTAVTLRLWPAPAEVRWLERPPRFAPNRFHRLLKRAFDPEEIFV